MAVLSNQQKLRSPFAIISFFLLTFSILIGQVDNNKVGGTEKRLEPKDLKGWYCAKSGVQFTDTHLNKSIEVREGEM